MPTRVRAERFSGGTLLVSIFKGFDSFTPKVGLTWLISSLFLLCPSCGTDRPQVNVTTLVTNYVALPTTIVAFVGYRLYHRSNMLKLEEIDLTTGIQEFRDMEEEETRYEGRFGWLRSMWSA